MLKQATRTAAAAAAYKQLGGERSMTSQGSAGNVIAAVCSLFVPGLGQLVQGRLGMAILQFVLAIFLWFFLLGWAIHLWSILDAALWKPPAATD
jgi:TM2 domain-containing membrane protein YozV